MYISSTPVSAPGYSRVQPRQDRSAQSEISEAARNTADAPRHAPAVRVVEGEVLSGRADEMATESLHRYVRTLRGMVEGEGHQQSAYNNSTRRAIQAYLNNAMSPADADTRSSTIIDFLV